MSHRSSERKSANGLNMMKSLFRHSQLDSILLLSCSLKPAKSGLGPGILSKGTSFFQHWLQFPFLLQSPWYKSTQPSRISNVQRCESVIVDLKNKKMLESQNAVHDTFMSEMRKLITFMHLFHVMRSRKPQTRHTRHESLVSALGHIPFYFFSQDSSTQDHRCILQKTCMLWKVAALSMTHDHQNGYFVRRINFVFGGTWEEISCKKYCLVFADLDFCNPKRGPCLAIILFHLPSTESTNINNHHVLQYLPLQWRCLA